jgi:hypothetical protein
MLRGRMFETFSPSSRKSHKKIVQKKESGNGPHCDIRDLNEDLQRRCEVARMKRYPDILNNQFLF